MEKALAQTVSGPLFNETSDPTIFRYAAKSLKDENTMVTHFVTEEFVFVSIVNRNTKATFEFVFQAEDDVYGTLEASLKNGGHFPTVLLDIFKNIASN